MHRGLLTVLLVLALMGASGPAGAEEPVSPAATLPTGAAAVPTIQGWLRTGDDRHAAWGAWEAGERNLRVLAPEIVHRLAREMAEAGSARCAILRLQLLDAIVRLEAEVTLDLLARVGWSEEAVVVWLCRQRAGPRHRAAFAHLDAHRDGHVSWLAVGGVLHRARDRTFVRSLLARWEIVRQVRVWDQEGPYGAWRGPHGNVPGDGLLDVPEGYPPTPLWRLSCLWEKDWDVLVPGVHSVRVHRQVDRDRRIGFSENIRTSKREHEARRAWLLQWLGDVGHEIPQEAALDVKWTGGRLAWQRAVREAVRPLHDAWRRWRDALVTQGLLHRTQLAGLTPRIRWREIEDRRRRAARPLLPWPEIPFDPRVQPLPSPRRYPH